MDPTVEASRIRVSRRRALGISGSIGLGALLAACAGQDAVSTGGQSGLATAPPTPTATDGTAISPTSSSSAELVAKLDAVGSCSLNTEETQGPYWFDVDAIRSDLREDRPGTTVALALRVYDASCAPIPDSVVEIWHCDAGGVYSGFESSSTGGAPGGGGGAGGARSGETSDGSYSAGDQEATASDDGTYLRGAQVADANGVVQFTTVWPGWYRGRTVHIHLKVHINKTTVLTTQLWFDDSLNTSVFQSSPYNGHTGRDTMNSDDSVIDATGQLTVEARADGYLAYANLGVSA